MGILSDDKQAMVEITRNDPADPHMGYTLKVEGCAGANRFAGQNDSVCFSRLDQFCDRLDGFLASRQSDVVLETTEDCRLEFYRWSSLNVFSGR